MPSKDVLTAIDQSPELRSRSPLSTWMRTNHDAFKARMESIQPNWTVLADLFAEAGLTDRFGNKPKPESARQLWMRIKKEMAEKPSSKPRTDTSHRREVSKPAPNPVAQPSSNEEIARVLGDMKSKDRNRFPDVV